MTFTIYKKPVTFKDSRNARLPYLPITNTLPLFVLPGILGFKKDLIPLADKLFTYSEQKRKIAIFNDDRNELSAIKDENFLLKVNIPLEEQARYIKEGIVNELHGLLRNNMTVPIAIAAFSYNAAVAMSVTNQLIRHFPNARITLYIIDGATPQCAEKFLSGNSLDLNQNLIEIVNYACRNAGFINLIANDTIEMNELEKRPSLAEKLSYLETIARRLNTPEETSSHDQFNTFIAMIKNDLSELCKKENTQIKLDEITTVKLLSIAKTKMHYQDQFLGWPAHTKLVLQNKALQDAPHSQLLSDEYAHVIAKDIHKTMRNIEHDDIQKSIAQEYQYNDDSDESSDESNLEPADEKIILDDEAPEIVFSPSDTSDSFLDNPSSSSSSDDSTELSTFEFASPVITAKSSIPTPNESGDSAPLDSVQLYKKLQEAGSSHHGFFAKTNSTNYLPNMKLPVTAPIEIPKQIAH